MKTVCETIGVARSHVGEQVKRRAAGASPKSAGRPPLPDAALVAEIQ